MKLANIDGQRREAQPGLSGKCPVCGAAAIARCGEKNIWHWAHKGKRKCDHWWENETGWHRDWKNHFPVEWQEIVHSADDGEKHIADVKTDQGWVIEFQHSYINPDERRSREAFYRDMVWVVDGLRRKNDRKQFTDAVRENRWVIQDQLVVTLPQYYCRIVDEWSTSRVPVFFDFGEEVFAFDERFQPRGLWLIIPTGFDHIAYLAMVGKEDLIGWHRKGDFNPQPLTDLMKTYERERVRTLKTQYVSQHRPRRMSRRPSRRF